MPCFVYILTNRPNGVLYTGLTTDLATRICQHRKGAIEGFTKKYQLKRLVWFEPHDLLEDARRRESAVKRWRRAWKISMIEEMNPDWRDLSEDLNR